MWANVEKLAKTAVAIFLLHEKRSNSSAYSECPDPEEAGFPFDSQGVFCRSVNEMSDSALYRLTFLDRKRSDRPHKALSQLDPPRLHPSSETMLRK